MAGAPAGRGHGGLPGGGAAPGRAARGAGAVRGRAGPQDLLGRRPGPPRRGGGRRRGRVEEADRPCRLAHGPRPRRPARPDRLAPARHRAAACPGWSCTPAPAAPTRSGRIAPRWAARSWATPSMAARCPGAPSGCTCSPARSTYRWTRRCRRRHPRPRTWWRRCTGADGTGPRPGARPDAAPPATTWAGARAVHRPGPTTSQDGERGGVCDLGHIWRSRASLGFPGWRGRPGLSRCPGGPRCLLLTQS